MLRTENPETDHQDILAKAAYELSVGERELQADYEHGQWWVTHLPTGAQWAVVDTETPGGLCFGFEQV